MAKVWKHNDRDVWVGDFRDATGKQVRLRTATHQDAEALLAEMINASREPVQNLEDRDILLKDYIARWTEAAKVDLTPKSLRSTAQLLTLHVLPALGSLRVRDLRRKHVKMLLNEKRRATWKRKPSATARPYSKNTIRLIKAALSTVLSEAVEEEILLANPALNIGRRGKKAAGHLTQTDVLKQIHPMTWEQKQVFEQALIELRQEGRVPYPYATAFQVLLKAGLRPGEAFALQPGDLDLFGQRVRVERAVDRGQIKSTKTAETRTVDLSADLAGKLAEYLTWLESEQLAQRSEAHQALQDAATTADPELKVRLETRSRLALAYAASPWLFPNEAGKLLDDAKARRVFHYVLKQATLPSFRVYDLRHTFASLLLSSGVPLLYVSKQLGHAKPTTTLRYYAHWIPSGDERHVDLLDRPAKKLAPKLGTTVDITESAPLSDTSEAAEVVENLGESTGAGEWGRTTDLLITNQLLCH